MRCKGLTKARKQDAVARCEAIEEALHSLLFDVINGLAYAIDLDKVNNLITTVQRLRYRFESYPELSPEFSEDLEELYSAGWRPGANMGRRAVQELAEYFREKRRSRP